MEKLADNEKFVYEDAIEELTKIVDKPTGWVIVLITSMSIMLKSGI